MLFICNNVLCIRGFLILFLSRFLAVDNKTMHNLHYINLKLFLDVIFVYYLLGVNVVLVAILCMYYLYNVICTVSVLEILEIIYTYT